MFCSDDCDCAVCSNNKEVFLSQLVESDAVDVSDDWADFDAALGLIDDVAY